MLPGSTATFKRAGASCAKFIPTLIPEITSRVTVPVLRDKARQTIVSNESSEIRRMLTWPSIR